MAQLPDRKRRHNTVWQYYLAAWEHEGAVACLRNGRAFRTGTRVLGVQTNFYALKELSTEEETFVRQIIENADPIVRGLNAGWMNILLYAFQIRRQLEFKGLDPARAREAIELLVSNAEEDLHARIESESAAHLNALRNGDPSFLQTDEDRRGMFLHFLCVQYFRTPKLLGKVVEALCEAPGIRGDHVWPVLRHTYATNLALSLSRRWPELRICHPCPPAGAEFITSDQPVINLAGVNTPPGEEAKELLLYYPVGPTRALLIEDSRDPRFESPDLTMEQVHQLNHDMLVMCHEQAFATREEILAALAR